MSWQKVKLKEVLKQYRVQHIVQDTNEYKQVSILNDGSVVLRGSKIGKEIGRKRQFIIDLNTYPDTLIFTRQLLLQGSIGIASEDVNNCIVTENMPMFSIQTSKIDKDFLILFLKSEVFKSRIRKIELSGSAQKSIHERTFLDLEFFIPKIEEQKEIVGELLKLKSHSNSISIEITHQLDLIKQLRQAFLREAMQGKLVGIAQLEESSETGQQLLAKIKAEKAQLIAEKKLKKEKELPPITADEIPFEIPEHWAWCRLGKVAYDLSYGTSQKADDSSEIPVLRMGNITTDGRILYSNLKFVSPNIKDLPKLYLKDNDLVFNRTNSYELVGKCGVFKNEAPYTLASYLIRVRLFEKINSNFISNYINSSFCRQTQIEPQIIQQNGQANFNGTKLSSIIIPLPPLHEQEQIVVKLEELMTFCDGLEQSIKESQGYNEKLLQQVLREALQGEKV